MTVPEANKREGVAYALHPSGLELPVIDVTHPAFAVNPTDEELAAMTAKFARDEARRAWVPKAVLRATMRVALSRSRIGRGLLAATGGFLDGTSTYLLKVGPDLLGDGYANKLDRTIAGSLPGLSMRMRVRNVAGLLARTVATASRAGPLHLVDIAGGPASDALNALIVLRRDHPDAVARPIRIHVFDQDAEGPAFAANCLAALRGPGMKLEGLDVELEHVRYDWTKPEILRDALAGMPADAVIAGSSEGGLLEYAHEDVIAANLAVLRPRACGFAGSVTRSDGLRPLMTVSDHAAVRPRTWAAFEGALVGWTVAERIDTPLSFDVALRPV
jgi:hypothetical protein